VTEKKPVRDDYDTEPENWGTWALRLDTLTGFGDPRAVARHAAQTGMIAGLRVAGVSIDKAQIAATNGWSAGWDLMEEEWLHLCEVGDETLALLSAREQGLVFEDLERIITDVRDAFPRRFDDVGSGEIVQALTGAVNAHALNTAARALRNAAALFAKDSEIPLIVAQALTDRATAIEAESKGLYTIPEQEA
jgi:hypothetical protein